MTCASGHRSTTLSKIFQFAYCLARERVVRFESISYSIRTGYNKFQFIGEGKEFMVAFYFKKITSVLLLKQCASIPKNKNFASLAL